MFELFRMDLRRMWAEKYLIILPVSIVAVLLGSYALMDLVSDPFMLDAMAAQGAEILVEDYEDARQLREFSMLQYLHTMLAGGGMWLVVVGCGAGIFCAGDYTRGAVKNIFPIFGRRWSYVIARAFSLLAMVLTLSVTCFACALLLKPFSLFETWGGTWLDWLQLFASSTLLGWAFALCMFFFAALVRGEGWMVVVALLLAMGLPATTLDGVADLLHLPRIGYYTLFGCSQRLTMTFQPDTYAQIVLICLVWGLVYLLLSTWVLERRDAA